MRKISPARWLKSQIRVVVSTIFTFQVFNHHRHLIREERYLANQTLKASRSTNTDLQPENLDQTVLVTLNPDAEMLREAVSLWVSTCSEPLYNSAILRRMS
ncbi:uncharacterized protein LOC130497840 [Raphanus sativus]|uniref:Uncharacterized protein LOC130497840 n=1 Tax=Raphanus sativus TaxID=3726 RepID=A0A9W3C6G8_RAPSA|nr:uncharacterized protein LOC130497840 [Raphanus sativus]